MKMGFGFVVVVPDKESETRLLRLLERRKDNYPIVSRRTYPRNKYPAKHIVTSLDGCFLKVNSLKEVENLGIAVRETTKEDIEFLGR